MSKTQEDDYIFSMPTLTVGADNTGGLNLLMNAGYLF